MADDPREVYRKDWLANHEYAKSVGDRLEAKLAASLQFTVDYGKSVLRTLLELNGGGLVALPSFAALFGSIWSRGDVWPFLAGAAFIAGLVSAAAGHGFAFYCFSEQQAEAKTTLTRVGDALGKAWQEYNDSKPIPPIGTSPSPDEILHQNKAREFNNRAIKAALFSMACFVVGALISGYVLTGNHPTGWLFKLFH